MCLIDGSNIDIESDGLEFTNYKCVDCDSKFKAIGKRVRCPTCESSHIEIVR